MKKHYDLLIKDGMVVDGKGYHRMDIAVNGEKISALEGEISSEDAMRIVDARGLCVLPGIIDALWNALGSGVLDVIASDHAPKGQRPEEDFLPPHTVPLKRRLYSGSVMTRL